MDDGGGVSSGQGQSPGLHRRSAGQRCTVAAGFLGLAGWPEVLPGLVNSGDGRQE